MKVLYFCPSENMYGDNIALLNIIPYLMKMGIEPYFIVPQHECALVDYLRNHNYKYYVITCRIGQFYSRNKKIRSWIMAMFYRIKRLFINIDYIKQAQQIFDVVKPDLIHSNSSNSRLGYNLAKYYHIPHVWHIREYGRLDSNYEYWPTKQYFIKKLKAEFNNNIAITPLINEYFGNLPNTKVIYDGVVNSDTPLPQIIDNKKKQILFCGRLIHKKGIEDVIQAFAAINSETSAFKLVVVGTGSKEYVSFLKELVDTLGITGKVDFLGYQKDVNHLMNESYALVMASEFEAFGFVTAEAMYNGLLVIGKNTAGTKLQMDNAKQFSGRELCIRYNTFQELKDVLKNVMACNTLQSNLRDAQVCVSSLYSIKKSAKNVFDYYQSILKL